MAGRQDDTLRIILVGKTGSGKSETANTILGKRAFDTGIGAHTITKSCQRQERAWKERKLLVVDTPGLFDVEETLRNTCKEIAKSVFLCSPGPHAIILVVRLDRFTEEDQNTFELIKAIFGEHVVKHMIILFTHKEDLSGQMLSNFIAKTNKCLKTIIKECGLRCCAFNNKTVDKAEKEGQVQELVEVIEALVQENGGPQSSNAIYKDAVKKHKSLEEALENMREHGEHALINEKRKKWLIEKCVRNKYQSKK